MLNLMATPKGNLFQEKVYRFVGPDNAKLPFHQFSVGDCVRITPSHGDPLSDTPLEGILMDRGQKYLDICLSVKDAASIDVFTKYRLDTMVNRVAFDRQIEALQRFLNPPSEDNMGISRAVRDIILYSYPNSMIQLANTPGGLKMALPCMDLSQPHLLSFGSDVIESDDLVEESKALSEAVEKGLQMMGGKKYREKGSEEDSTLNDKMRSEIEAPKKQLQQRISYEKSKDTSQLREKHERTFLCFMNDMKRREMAVFLSFLLLFSFFSLLFSPFSCPFLFLEGDHVQSRTDLASRIDDAEEAPINEAIFNTNTRLRSMAETFTTSNTSKIATYTQSEIEDAINKTTELCPMNPSQLLALEKAITQTVTLIQGPPGTGKTRTACAMLAAIVNLKNQRILTSPSKNAGAHLHKILACAHSNIAADNLLEGLVSQGVKVVRLGEKSLVKWFCDE